MPSKSMSQKRLFCLAYAHKHGLLPEGMPVSKGVENIAKTMSDDKLRHFMVLKDRGSAEKD